MDGLLRPTLIDPAQNTLMRYAYAYDAAGNITMKGSKHMKHGGDSSASPTSKMRQTRPDPNAFFNRIDFIILICLLASVASKPASLYAKENVGVYRAITIHAERAQFDETIKLLADYKWSESTNPLVIVIYCDALFERQVSISDADRLFHRMPSHIQRFAKAMIRLSYGKVLEAKTLLDKFSWPPYDYLKQIGQLEIAQTTENYISMAPFLELLRSQASKHLDMGPILGFYNVVYYFNIGKFEEASSLLNRQDLHEDLNLLSYKVELLARNDDFEAANQLLDDVQEKYGVIRSFVIYKGWLTALQFGPKKAVDFYAKIHQGHPLFFNAAWLRAIYLFASKKPDSDFEGVTSIKKLLLEERPFDYRLILDSVNVLFSIGSNFEAVDFLNRAEQLADIDQFLLYDLIAARIYDEKVRYAKNNAIIYNSLKMRDKFIASALNKAPYHWDTLWFKFSILKEAKNANQAIDVLKDILHADLGNLDALIELARLYKLAGEGNEKIKPLLLKIKSSHRYRKLPSGIPGVYMDRPALQG